MIICQVIIKKNLRSFNNRNAPVDKITNNNNSTLTNAIIENKKQPYFGSYLV